MSFQIALVAKPSTGKSTTLNALSDAQAKVAAYPFTTIEPNKATGYVQVECACARFNTQEQCKPNYGWCSEGRRYVPVMLLDVAGLVPGAHEGKGLGNKFLDDLRHADAFIHVVDVSGTTDAEGKATRGYDPSFDIEWLQDEIFRWVKGNLQERWGSIKRRHAATKSSNVDTLLGQFGGYGANRELVTRAVAKAERKAEQQIEHEPGKPALGSLETWSDEQLDLVIKTFMEEKFPTVLALNKVDHPDSDKNIAKIAKMYPKIPQVLTSAMSEVFLRKLVKQNYIKYESGTEFVDTLEDLPDSGLRPMDEKLKERVETVRDLVLYRFGSTGVMNVLIEAVNSLQLIPVFTVRNIHKHVFPDCILVRSGTKIGAVMRKIMGDAPVMYIEGVGGQKLSEEDEISKGKNDILFFKVGR